MLGIRVMKMNNLVSTYQELVMGNLTKFQYGIVNIALSGVRGGSEWGN